MLSFDVIGCVTVTQEHGHSLRTNSGCVAGVLEGGGGQMSNSMISFILNPMFTLIAVAPPPHR